MSRWRCDSSSSYETSASILLCYFKYLISPWKGISILIQSFNIGASMLSSVHSGVRISIHVLSMSIHDHEHHTRFPLNSQAVLWCFGISDKSAKGWEWHFLVRSFSRGWSRIFCRGGQESSKRATCPFERVFETLNPPLDPPTHFGRWLMSRCPPRLCNPAGQSSRPEISFTISRLLSVIH